MACYVCTTLCLVVLVCFAKAKQQQPPTSGGALLWRYDCKTDNPDGSLFAAFPSHDGTSFFVGCVGNAEHEDVLYALSPTDGTVQHTYTNAGGYSNMLSADSRILYSTTEVDTSWGQETDFVLATELASDTILWKTTEDTSEVHATAGTTGLVALSPNGKVLFLRYQSVGQEVNHMLAVRTDNGGVLWNVSYSAFGPCSSPYNDGVVTTDGAKLLVGSCAMNASTGSVIWLGYDDAPCSPILSSDGSFAYALSSSPAKLVVHRTSDWAVVVDDDFAAYWIGSIGPGSDFLTVDRYVFPCTLSRVDLKLNIAWSFTENHTSIESVCTTRSGAAVFAVSADLTVHALDGRSGSMLWVHIGTFSGTMNPVKCALSPDDAILYVFDGNNSAFAFRTGTGQPVSTTSSATTTTQPPGLPHQQIVEIAIGSAACLAVAAAIVVAVICCRRGNKRQPPAASQRLHEKLMETDR